MKKSFEENLDKLSEIVLKQVLSPENQKRVVANMWKSPGPFSLNWLRDHCKAK